MTSTFIFFQWITTVELSGAHHPVAIPSNIQDILHPFENPSKTSLITESFISLSIILV